MNALTIADALAGKFAPAAITPPTGYTNQNIRVSTARLPNAIPSSPCVHVLLPNGELVLGSQELNHKMEFHVLFHYAKHSADTARDMTALLAWLGVLLTATFSDMDLSVTPAGSVRKAYPTEYALAVLTYGGQEFYGWDITFIVDFRENQVMVP